LTSDFRLYQSLLVIIIVTLWVIISAGAIEYFQWHRSFAPGLLIHTGIIIICLACTAYFIKSQRISVLFGALNFKKTGWHFYLIALVIAAIIWVADFWLQLFFFLDNGKEDSLAMQTEIKHFGSISVVLAICFFAPVAEEILFRGIILKGLMNSLSPLGSILISSVLFAAIHFSPNDFLTLFIAATGYAILTLKAQSIWPAIIAHVINNSLTVYYLSTL
jgi:membrane protease YdiL (CAAX protease family)